MAGQGGRWNSGSGYEGLIEDVAGVLAQVGEFAYKRLTDRRVIYYLQKLAKPWRDSPTSTLKAQMVKHQNTESKLT